MTNDKLKPCPFCGGKAENLSDYSCDCCGKPYNGNIQCETCGAEVSHFDTDAEAIAAWNTRADAEALKAADELAEAVAELTKRGVSPATGGRLILEVDVEYAEKTLAKYNAKRGERE